MRGTQAGRIVCIQMQGIIPAYAGNTYPRGKSCGRPRDHPRVCGEHMREMERAGESPGSSPRMRGTLTVIIVVNIGAGIIPAYAGNTKPVLRTPRGIWDHPRVCGEHLLIMTNQRKHDGSSPRMRGTLLYLRYGNGVIGIIPAYAGNTAAGSIGLSGARDHPRVCGEHFLLISACSAALGSSPRMRGTHYPHIMSQITAGIIPAYAGNTLRD